MIMPNYLFLMMSPITSAKVTVAAALFSLFSLSQLGYFAPKYLLCKYSLCSTTPFRDCLSNYKFPFGFWVLHSAAEVILLALSWTFGDQTFAYWCLFGRMTSALVAHTFFL